ncbi:hypothetical protein NCC49_004045 [Naganishia albida]|nr:hypothetical protein NCC49_004045 [Naganishia albida]
MSFPLLVSQALATFLASVLIGYLPLTFTALLGADTKPLKCISVVGMGLLVGSALTIIIPEGVSTLYDSLPEDETREKGDHSAHATRWIGAALLAGFGLMLLVESLTPHPSHEPDDHHDYAHLPTHTHPGSPHHHHHHHHAEDGLPRTASHESTTSTTIFDAEQEAQLGGPAKGRFALRKASTSDDSPWINDSSADNERGQPFGGSIPPSAHVPIHPAGHTETDLPPHLRQNSRTALFPSSLHRHRDSNTSADRCQEALGGASGRGVAGLNATLGLVIHAMADGIALGASSLSGSGGLGLVVFLAVIVHKGPTAMGLTTTLLSLGLTKPQIRTRLLLFSISAPLGAVITYLVVSAAGAGQVEVPDDQVDPIGWWTGIVLLFSGGSFLYVATVISPLSDSDAHGTHQHAHQGMHDAAEGQALGQKTRLGLLLVGMVGPLLLSLVVSHSH